jgi:(p)ppGpp synthase/HD superfamily hydrolase
MNKQFPKLTPDEMLDDMLVLIATEFKGKRDKGGRPYALHCMTVMYFLKTDDVELQVIGLGHDLIEDTRITAEELRRRGYSERVIAGIVALSKRDGESGEEYFARVTANDDAILVKICDISHNTDIRRLKGLREKDFLRMQKYHHMYTALKALACERNLPTRR